MPQSALLLEDSSSEDKSESTSDRVTTNNSSSGNEDAPLVHNETRVVNRSKLLVYVALFVTAAAVGGAAYFFATREEHNNFKNAFFVAANEVIDNADSNSVKIFGQMKSLSTTLTSYALSANLTWPNVSLPDFDRRAQEAIALSGAEEIIFAPIVHKDNKVLWEQYSWEHQGWIKEGLEFRDWKNIVAPGSITTSIYPFTEEMEHHGAHFGHEEHEHEEDQHDEEHHDEDYHDKEHYDEDHHDEDHHDDDEENEHDEENHEAGGVTDDGEHNDEHDDEHHHEHNDESENEEHDDEEHREDEHENDENGEHDEEDHHEDGENKGIEDVLDIFGGDDRDRRLLAEEHAHEHESEGGSHGKTGHDDHGEHDSHGEHNEEILAFVESIHVPIWQYAPVPTNASIVNLDLSTHPVFNHMIIDVIEVKNKLLSEVVDLHFLIQERPGNDDDEGGHSNHAHSFILEPVFDSFTDNAQVVGFIVAVLPWQQYFQNVLPSGTNGIVVDVKETCGSKFSYIINGNEAFLLLEGDQHSAKYDYLKQSYDFAKGTRFHTEEEAHEHAEKAHGAVHCEYTIDVLPSEVFEASYTSNKPILYTSIVVLIFVITIMVFVLYDCAVQRRQARVLGTAQRTAAIVSSLFPKNVQKRIMAEAEAEAEKQVKAKKKGFGFVPKNQLKEFLGATDEGFGNDNANSIRKTKPIADLFPETTILFADIVGFTAWSSMREPTQVFTLLETIYNEFDEIAKRRRVYKVETVGDCYVAVAGLPDPRKDHAVVMARFSRDCLYKVSLVLKELELTLGPDTAELGFRFGLHSGPVTAGVLRGDRSRFQLFGDSVNTTARIEATGAKNKIHISQETADLLIVAGKSHWLRPREEKVVAKGKGELTTYWLELKGDKSSASGNSSESGGSPELHNRPTTTYQDCTNKDTGNLDESIAAEVVSEKQLRLIDWNTEVLTNLLKQIFVQRKACGIKPDAPSKMFQIEQIQQARNTQVLDEVREIVILPQFDHKASEFESELDSIELDCSVVEQLHEYVQTIADMYNDKNPFHNFDHASHVSMSVIKLLRRIIAPDLDGNQSDTTVASTLHDHTYGITSDPLTQFTVVFSALIHDVDHAGVPNAQLVKEKSDLASAYKNKSVLEQNSVNIAWNLLMGDRFVDLRRAIYETESEFKRFRQLLVNTVMATDIMDVDLGALRKERWNKAFSEVAQDEENAVCVNRKATIVIEHLIQASDVAHTMQHWHIYRKWNQRFFLECYTTYKEGRADKDPSESWFQGEIGFFDYYIIPLAKKLKNCGVFGVSSDEYLNYAKQNRLEWELKGQSLVAEMKAEVEAHDGMNLTE